MVPAADLTLVIATVPVAASAAPGAAPVYPAYNVKAGLIRLFAQYVDWPAEAFANPTDSVVIGVLGDNPFGEVLESTVQGLKSHGRPLEVRYVKTAEEAVKCQVVFIAQWQKRDEALWLRALRGKPVLTVTESEQGIAHGAVLSFVLDKTANGTKVKFDASLPAAREAGLQISARMLQTARKVIREPTENKDET